MTRFGRAMALCAVLVGLAAACSRDTTAPPQKLTVAASVNAKCSTIQSGLIHDALGNVLQPGFDQFGYNYQAHQYVGTYDGLDRVLDGKYYGQTGDFVDDKIDMKWSDAWLANVDCDGDGLLDRGLVDGVASGVSMGWLTNHMVGDYTDANGDLQHYTEFTKIVWTGPGSPLWGEYTVVLDNYQDSGGGSYHVKQPTPGFGLNDHWTVLQ